MDMKLGSICLERGIIKGRMVDLCSINPVNYGRKGVFMQIVEIDIKNFRGIRSFKQSFYNKKIGLPYRTR